MSYQKWNTLLKLKENHKLLGLKGWTYFIVDFPLNIETNEMEFMIAQPTFTGLGVGVGISSFVMRKEKINELFDVLDKTFEQYEKELMENT